MAFTNFETKEINCKVVYFGPESAGKTENLRSIYSRTSIEMKSGLMELNENASAGQYFEFLPISLGYVDDFHIKLHLFSLPKVNLFDTVMPVLLKGVDGTVFVVDSRIESLEANEECLANVEKTFFAEGVKLKDLPMVVQYNKRDLDEIMPLNLLQSELNLSHAPEQEAIAIDSIGTMETLHQMAKIILKNLASS